MRRLVLGLAALALAGEAVAASPKPPQKPPQKPPASAAAKAPPKAPANTLEAAPGLAGSWRQLFRHADSFGMIDAGSLRRAGDRAGFNMALAMRAPITTETMSAGVLINVMEADCKAGSARTLRTLAFSDEGRLQFDTGALNQAPETPPPQSTLAVVIQMACGQRPLPEQPQWTDPVVARKGWLAANP